MTTILYMFFPNIGGEAAALVYGPIRVVAAQVYRPGAMAAAVYRPGMMAGESLT